MRSWLAVILVAGALALAGCGSSGGTAASRQAPPNPLGVSVVITNARVVASPRSFGAGPVLFTVTNQAHGSQSLRIRRRHGPRVADTAPLNPQGSTQLSVIFRRGRYTLDAGFHGRNHAQFRQGRIRPQTIVVGRTRPSSGSTLLSP
ncbi:MAG TPA: hypothetical protein VJU80_10630 [Solirubrobacteraceae bacterium]|nr:hypothetical protein [Solirubrobacteraceae bacterium]